MKKQFYKDLIKVMNDLSNSKVDSFISFKRLVEFRSKYYAKIKELSR